MKERIGFVSNSSSSSFVVTCKEDRLPVFERTVTQRIDLNHYQEAKVSNEEELKKYLEAEYCEDMEERFGREAQKIKNALANGEKIFFLSASDQPEEYGTDEARLEIELCDCGIPEEAETVGIKIIEGEGGY